jgi:Condensation domain
MPEPFVFPASSQQAALWRLHRRNPGLYAYDLGIELVIGGRLDPSVLERALNEVVRRHEPLRTTFAERGGEVVQVVAPDRELPLPLTDLGGLAEPESEAAVAEIELREATTPGDLERGPLLRTRLLRTAEQRHVLVLVVNHMVFDGHSMRVFLRETCDLYAAFAEGRASPMPALPVQYVDYCAWQRQRLQSPSVAPQLAYWLRTLAGTPGVHLPTDRPWPAALGFGGGRLEFDLPVRLCADLEALARAEGTSTYMVLVAGFQALLHLSSGQTDLAIRSPVTGRGRPELEPLIGFFVNRVVLRTDLSGDPTYRELLARVKRVVVDAFANQDAPFERVLEELPPAPEGPPPFQVGLNLMTVQDGRPDAELPFRLEGHQFDNGTAKFPLTLEVSWTPTRVLGVLEYSGDLFDRPTVERVRDDLLGLLARAATNPGRRLSELGSAPVEAWARREGS